MDDQNDRLAKGTKMAGLQLVSLLSCLSMDRSIHPSADAIVSIRDTTKTR
jgi:hypothetical protein